MQVQLRLRNGKCGSPSCQKPRVVNRGFFILTTILHMKVLMIGDVVAKPGRIAVLERIQDLREQHQIDFAIMTAENLAGGLPVTPHLREHLFAPGIDVMTSANPIFEKKEAIDYTRKQPRLL